MDLGVAHDEVIDALATTRWGILALLGRIGAAGMTGRELRTLVCTIARGADPLSDVRLVRDERPIAFEELMAEALSDMLIAWRHTDRTAHGLCSLAERIAVGETREVADAIESYVEASSISLSGHYGKDFPRPRDVRR